MQSGVDLVFLFVNEVDAHAHVEVDVDLVRLVQLDAGILVLAGGVIRVEPVVEEFGFHGHLGMQEAQLVPRVKAITLRFLELLVSLGRTRWTMMLLAWSLRLGATLLLRLLLRLLLVRLLLGLPRVGVGGLRCRVRPTLVCLVIPTLLHLLALALDSLGSCLILVAESGVHSG